MPRVLKRLLVAIIILVCGYYVLRTIAEVQIGASAAKCVKEDKFLGKSDGFKNEEEARAVANAIFECMERRNGLFARLFFDKNKANRSLIYSNN